MSTPKDSTGSPEGQKDSHIVEITRTWLAFIVIGSFMAVTVTMLMYALFSGGRFELKDYAAFFSQTSSVYTGIVGVVIGFYFGRSTESGSRTRNAAKTPEPSQPSSSSEPEKTTE